jgi:ArsR family transcriptional regulator
MSLEAFFKALGDPVRLKILNFLGKDEKCVCEIIPATGKSQPNVSRHLKILEEAGILQKTRRGKKVFFKVSNSQIFYLLKVAGECV